MSKRPVHFEIDRELYKEFSKKAIDLDKTKTEILIELIKSFLKKK